MTKGEKMRMMKIEIKKLPCNMSKKDMDGISAKIKLD